MVARSDLRFAGLAALVTAALLAAHAISYAGGPQTERASTVLAWHVNHQTEARVAAILWLIAMLSFVVFAIAFREAMWASIIDRHWISTGFVQGAGVFATIAVIWAAMSWALAIAAGSGDFEATEIALLWTVAAAFKQFAMYGLVAPLLLVGVTLLRHSVAGRVLAVAALGISVTLIAPPYSGWALPALAGWLAATGLVLVVPTMASLKASKVHREPADAT